VFTKLLGDANQQSTDATRDAQNAKGLGKIVNPQTSNAPAANKDPSLLSASG
jgi:hypothetical protein